MNGQKPNYISNSIIYFILNLLRMLILNKKIEIIFFLCLREKDMNFCYESIKIVNTKYHINSV